MTLDTATLRTQWEAIREQQGPEAFAMIAHVGDGIALLDALDVLTAALQWYADEKNWDYVEWDWEARVLVGKVDNDVGERARAALATAGGEGATT